MKLLLNGSEAQNEVAVDSLILSDSESGRADSLRLCVKNFDMDVRTVEVLEGAIKTGALTVLCAEKTRDRTYLTAGALSPAAKTPHYQVWEDVSLSRLVSELSSRMGFAAKTYGLPNVSYKWLSQTGEEDCAFLRRRLTLEGCHMKIAPGAMIAYDAKMIDSSAPVREIDLSAIPYQQVTRAYQMKREATVFCESVSGRAVCDLDGGSLLFADVPARSIGEAQRYARGLLRQANEGAKSLAFTIPLDTNLAAGSVFSALSENWVIANVSHDLVKQTSKIEGRAPLLW